MKTERDKGLEQFVLPEMNALDDIAAVVEHASNVLRVHGTREMRIAMMSSVAGRRRDPLE